MRTESELSQDARGVNPVFGLLLLVVLCVSVTVLAGMAIFVL